MSENEKPDRMFNFTLSETHANMILNALADLPFRTVADLVNSLHTQANAQMARENQPDES